MHSERLKSPPSTWISFDTETHKIQPGLVAPPLVCASIGAWDGTAARGELLSKEQAREAFLAILKNEQLTIAGANLPYDLLVMAVDAARRGVNLMPAIFALLGGPDVNGGRAFDIQTAEALHGVAMGTLGKDPDTGAPLTNPETGKRGRYSLAIVTKLLTGRENAKANDRFRFSYQLLEDTPIAEWPSEARIYPVDDAVNTLEDALLQTGAIGLIGPRKNLHDLSRQVYAHFAMHLAGSWGFTVDPAAVDVLETRVVKERAEGIGQFIEAGFYKLKPGTREPLTSPKTGAPCKNEAHIKRLTALAYGCVGSCGDCGGTGRVPGTTKCKACDGDGFAARVPAGDNVSSCTVCYGSGRVDNPKTSKGCDTCDGTALDLKSAPVPLTETGGVSVGRDALSESGDETLMAFASFGEDDKIPSTYIPWLRSGIGADGRPIPLTLRPNVLLDNGRASYDGVVQLLPRGGGIRECIVARPGKVLCSCDYGGLELVTHAQSVRWILGWSKLADALNSGVKVHDALGASMAGWSYDEMLRRAKEGDKAAKAYRQAAKPANFGFPGGMGAVKLVLQQRKSGPDTEGPDGRKYRGLRFCLLTGGETTCGHTKVTKWGKAPYEREIPPTCRRCIECAEEIRDKWFRQWPENKPYFDYISQIVDTRGEIEQHVSKRIRGGVAFCDAANGYFSSLAAEGAKHALCRAAFEEYVVQDSPLYGCRTILFAHDELVVEMPEDRAHEAAQRLSQVMVESMRIYTPDVIVEAPPALMRRWYKGAEPVYVDGRLVPWEPKS